MMNKAEKRCSSSRLEIKCSSKRDRDLEDVGDLDPAGGENDGGAGNHEKKPGDGIENAAKVRKVSQKPEQDPGQDREGQGDKEKGEGKGSGGSEAAIGMLQQVVGAIKGSVEGTMQKMQQSLAQSVSAMEQMNGMMEEYVLQSISCETSFFQAENAKSETCDQCWFLRGTVLNKSKIPVQDVLIECSIDTVDESWSWVKPIQVLKAKEEVAFQAPDPLEIQHQLNHGGNLRRYQGRVKIKFPSPGTGQPLVKHVKPTTLRILDQVDFRLVDKDEAKKEISNLDSDQILLHLDLSKHSLPNLRDLFKIDPLNGMTIPASYLDKKLKVVVQVFSQPSNKDYPYGLDLHTDVLGLEKELKEAFE